MIRGFYTGRTGAAEQQKALAVAANNIANVNTDGHKASNASFQELVYTRMRMPDDYEQRQAHYDRNVWHNSAGRRPPGSVRGRGDDDFDDYGDTGDYWDGNYYTGEGRVGTVNYFAENKLRAGAGGRMAGTAPVMTQGAFLTTGDALDVFIRGDAFFAVQSPNGEIAYTKHGAFGVSQEDGGDFLVTAGGMYVLDGNLERIALPLDLTRRAQIRIVSHNFEGLDEEANIVRVGLFTCDNIYGLARIGGNLFMPTEFSGEMELETRDGVDVITHGIEASNVSIAEEMVKVIQAQRAFQANLTVIRTADEIEGYINNLRQ